MTVLVWCDLETTGLDPQNDRILEIAWAFARLESPFAIGNLSSCVFADAPDALTVPFVREMHTKNGLWKDCAKSTVTPQHMDAALAEQIAGILPGADEKPILAGSTIHFDLQFLRARMPATYAELSHRVYDVSAVKLFCRSLGMPPLPKMEAHRAKDDILESISHAMLCANWLRNAL